MSNQSPPRKFTRRDFLKFGRDLVILGAGLRFLPSMAGSVLAPATPAQAQLAPTYHLAGSDGWISLPGSVPDPAGPIPFMPDPLAPLTANPANPAAGETFTTYSFGFRDVTGFSDSMVQNQRNKTQASAPLLILDQEQEATIKLTNLGLAVRPDLTDSHTIHFHGFRNAIPLFDGVPEMSIAVPIGRDFTYYYKAHDPGTYMYHCHFEDVEHVSMGMTGIVFVRPAQNKTGNGAGAPIARYNGGSSGAPLGYAYNDGVSLANPNSTAYDREWGLFLSEMWAEERFRDAHIQENDWSDFHPDVWLMNGRSYPDTIAPNGAGHDASGDLIPTPGYEHLQYQPISSLVTANSGERVLLRFVNLGYQQHAMTLAGIPMRVVGKDATLLRGLNGAGVRGASGADISYLTNTVYIGPGESIDAIFTAPTVASETTYRLYNRNYAYLHNPGQSGLGGQMTEVRIRPSGPGGYPAQLTPNT
jgi:FtsP/CotA-like multicopper oxidase with cupredoxin domain